MILYSAIFFSLILTTPASAGDLSLISIPSAEITAYPGSPMLVSVTARSESGLPIVYEWKKDGKVLAGETSNVLVVPSAKPSTAGIYSVSAKTASENKSAEAKVIVSKTKLPKARKPTATAAPAASCHTQNPAEKPAEKPKDHSHHHHH